MSRKQFIILTLLLCITGLFVRSLQIDRMALWGDEACMVYLCQDSIPDIVGALQSPDRPDVDVAPPVYFVLLHLWFSIFGWGVVAFRAYSVFWGVLTILASILAGTELFSRKTGLITGLLVALSPFQIWYSQEGRMYSMAAFFAVMTVLGMARVFRRPERVSSWLSFIIPGILLIYTQYYGVLLLAALYCALIMKVFLERQRQQRQFLLRGFWASAVLTTLAYLPWLPTVITDYSHAGSPGGFPSFFHPLQTPIFLFIKMTVFGNHFFILQHTWLYPPILLIFCYVIYRGLSRWRDHGILMTAAAVLLPFLAVYTASLAGLQVYKSHPFILFHVPLLIIAAEGLRHESKKRLMILITIICCAHLYVTSALVLGGNYVKPRIHHSVDWISSQYQDDDRVAVIPAFIPNPMPVVGDLLTFRYHSADRFDTLYLTGNTAEEIAETIIQGFPGSGKLFLVFQMNEQVLPGVEKIRELLATRYNRQSHKIFESRSRGFSTGVDVYLRQSGHEL